MNASVTIDVTTDCCETGLLNGAVPIQISAGEYTSTPFTATQPNAIYMVNGTITLKSHTASLDHGAKVLMAPGANIVLVENSRLILQNGTITAACNEMWGGIFVYPQSDGVRMEHSGYITNFPGNNIVNQNSIIRHSANGIVMVAAFPGHNAYLQIQRTTFQHNTQSVELQRVEAPALVGDYIRSCRFESDPTRFKSPLQYQSASKYNYAQRHVVLAGDVRPVSITKNEFRNALFGVYSTGYDAVQATLTANTFANCWLSGIYNGSLNTTSTYALGNLSTGLASRNTFVFPTAATLPATIQVSAAIANDLAEPSDATYGVNLHRGTLTSYYSRFVQPDSAGMSNYGSFSAYHPQQIGIAVRQPLVAHFNRFDLLDLGIAQRYASSLATPVPVSDLLANGFVHCRVGLEMRWSGKCGQNRVLSFECHERQSPTQKTSAL